MTAPSKCDVCGTAHHEHQAHRFATRVVSVEPVAVDESKWVLRGSSNAQVTHANEVTHAVTHKKNRLIDLRTMVPIGLVEKVSEVARSAAAEKQRRWREAHKDEVRANNRERMRRARARS